jgi:hypothetical protein
MENAGAAVARTSLKCGGAGGELLEFGVIRHAHRLGGGRYERADDTAWVFWIAVRKAHFAREGKDAGGKKHAHNG